MTKIKDLIGKYGNREIDEVELEKILKPEKVKTIYNLENGDVYHVIEENGMCDWRYWVDNDLNNKKLSVGNVFLTREDAEFEAEYRRVKTELKRYASMCEEPVDWNSNDQAKYYLCYEHYYREIDIATKRSLSHDDIFFTDEDILKQAIKEIGKERIKKYYLGVQEEIE